MQSRFSAFIAAVAWFAVITQFILMLQNRIAPVLETTLRFFSFFTILTNTLVAIYFTYQSFKKPLSPNAVLNKPGTLTALTVYITVVGIVYQIVLRQVWEPTGLQKWVDELLHSIIPILVVSYWYRYENIAQVSMKRIPYWLVFPLVYLLYILLRGHLSDFYPYPFVNIVEIGLPQVLINSAILFVVFATLSAAFIGLGRFFQKRSSE
ncbi:Pr6Pr family membrane protein [Dyadobacter tibetensis]|uniref:Pr6Pr family membrane protein n=1 Tax=Dyadobacter tibetensis TaxID=1211851 RepID=UPI00046FAC58|nr:Pr6Pr family membrane protein [Dyadobacter tibetensis]